jgi:hypothetical protein
MAAPYYVGISDVGLIADGDLSASANQYRFVTLSACADDKVYLSAAASAPYPFGILQNSPCSGEEAQVRVLGFSRLRVDTAQTADMAGTSPIYNNNWIQSGSTGLGIKAACVGTAEAVQARVVSGSVASGSAFIVVQLYPMGFTSATAS